MGQYHDILPNLIQQIVDLQRQGLAPVATLLRDHIANCSKQYLQPNASSAPIFCGFADIDMASMVEIEQRVMKRYAELFKLNLGPICYNSFVMMIDAARRRLLQDPWAIFTDCLPNLSDLDIKYGPCDRRSLDVISLRVEILKHRGQYELVASEASALIQRAELIQDDKWQRLYNLIRGWFFLGHSQYVSEKRDEAVESLAMMLLYDAQFQPMDFWNIFGAERVIATKCLEKLKRHLPKSSSVI